MSKGEWTHLVCEWCWGEMSPGRRASRLVDPDPGLCCRCGAHTTSGIYLRAHPQTMMCRRD